jgi:hypothetical protein
MYLTSPSSRVSPLLFQIIVLIVLLSIASIFNVFDVPQESSGPGAEIVKVAKNLINGGGISLPEYDTLHQDLLLMSKNATGSVWQDVYSLSQSGDLVCKHPLLMSILELPFIWAFGDAGLVIFSIMCGFLAFLGVYKILSRYIERPPTFRSIILLFAATPIVFYSVRPSYDLVIMALTLWGIYFLPYAPLRGGLLVCMGIFLRPFHVLCPLLLLFSPELKDIGGRLRFLAGVALVMSCFFLQNWFLWGGPFESAHARMPMYQAGEMIFNKAPVHFSFSIFLSDWGAKLFGLKGGFLLYNSLLLILLLPLTSWCYSHTRSKSIPESRFQRAEVFYSVVSLVLILVIFAYEGWNSTLFGSRYLLVSHALLSIVSLSFIERRITDKNVLPSGGANCHAGPTRTA